MEKLEMLTGFIGEFGTLKEFYNKDVQFPAKIGSGGTKKLFTTTQIIEGFRVPRTSQGIKWRAVFWQVLLRRLCSVGRPPLIFLSHTSRTARGGCPLVIHGPTCELLPAIRRLFSFCTFFYPRPALASPILFRANFPSWPPFSFFVMAGCFFLLNGFATVQAPRLFFLVVTTCETSVFLYLVFSRPLIFFWHFVKGIIMLMDLHEIIVESQDILNDAIVADEAGDLKEAYNQMDKLHDLLVEEFVPMEHP